MKDIFKIEVEEKEPIVNLPKEEIILQVSMTMNNSAKKNDNSQTKNDEICTID